MSCNLTEKVSLWIDGELTADEAEQLDRHVAACPVCGSAREDFLRLRQRVKAYEFTPDREARRQALAHILRAAPVPLWQRRLALPVPVFAVIVLTMALAVWVIFPRLAAKPSPAGGRPAPQPSDAATARASQSHFDLSRFDRGERAEIFTERRRPQP
jgi:anti-sigma factor RsiW